MDSSLEKKLLVRFLFYGGLAVFILVLLGNVIIRLSNDSSFILYIFVAFDGLMFGYFGYRALFYYKKYALYKKYGVRGTWGD